MKKTFYFLLSILFVPTILMLYSYNSGSPGGKTGSTGDGGATCTACHSGTASMQGGWITSDIPAEGYTAGETYTITVTGTHSGVVKMGYELTAENMFGNKKGTWTITETGRTQLANLNASVTHTAGGTGVSGNTNTWSADWTAPVAGSGSIKFNTAVNAANGNGSSTGDQIYTSMLNVSEAVVLNPEIVNVDPDSGLQGWSGSVMITGNETMWNEGVETVVFKYHDDNSIALTPTSFAVNSNTLITAMMNIPEDQQIGMYDVWVDDIFMENGFEVEELILNLEITSVDPDHAPQEWTGMITVTGNETQWENGVATVAIKFHDDNMIMLDADNFMVISDTEIHANFIIPVDQAIGVYDFYVDGIMLENGFTVDILDGLNEDELAENVNVYPIPAHNYLNIDLPESTEIKIYDLRGTELLHIQNAATQELLDISSFENGIYFVRVLSEHKSTTVKFIKN